MAPPVFKLPPATSTKAKTEQSTFRAYINAHPSMLAYANTVYKADLPAHQAGVVRRLQHGRIDRGLHHQLAAGLAAHQRRGARGQVEGSDHARHEHKNALQV